MKNTFTALASAAVAWGAIASVDAQRLAQHLVATARAPYAAASDFLQGPDADWPTIGGNLGQTRFSRLTLITPSNVKDLQLAWTASFDGDVVNEVETELLVSNGVLYLVTGNGNVV